MTVILGFDPGRDKCGVAVQNSDRAIVFHQVIESKRAISTIKQLSQQYGVELIVMGDKTTAKSWFKQLKTHLNTNLPIVMVDENNSTLEARDRYWQMYPAQGLTRLIPQSLRVPPRPVDDIVAILLIERYLSLSIEH